jgi:hypothetical protein
MLELARTNRAKAILVAMPAREGYPIDPAVIEVLTQHDATFLDCRVVPGLTTADFEDGWHLNPNGAKIFTAYMAEKFPGVVKSSGLLTVQPTR